jgi:hypothetical protein
MRDSHRNTLAKCERPSLSEIVGLSNVVQVMLTVSRWVTLRENEVIVKKDTLGMRLAYISLCVRRTACPSRPSADLFGGSAGPRTCCELSWARRPGL